MLQEQTHNYYHETPYPHSSTYLRATDINGRTWDVNPHSMCAWEVCGDPDTGDFADVFDVELEFVGPGPARAIAHCFGQVSGPFVLYFDAETWDEVREMWEQGRTGR